MGYSGGFYEAHHLVGHGDRLEDRAVVVLFVVEVLSVTAVLVLLAAAARTGGVAGQFFASHFSLLAASSLVSPRKPLRAPAQCW
jgi:hypothetical protein